MNTNAFLTVTAISASLLGLIGCGGPAEKFICGDCGAEFDSEEELDAHMKETHPPEPPDEPVTLSDEAMELPAGTTVAVLELEKGGVIEFELLTEETPETAGNFVTLCDEKFYDGLAFHRVVKGFVIQAGDPTFVGGEPVDVTIPEEPDARKFKRGAVSMARMATEDESGNTVYGGTSGNEFFITTGEASHLDPDFCVFGWVITGMDTADIVAQGTIIKRIRVIEVPPE
ncbi:MAG: peptidylprolyl isomerase [Candidatus Coatesbacteria bacterium]|nr:MAG: peptidylprolyl isomerase [Candidatus Coatesbacteria bacterium]